MTTKTLQEQFYEAVKKEGVTFAKREQSALPLKKEAEIQDLPNILREAKGIKYCHSSHYNFRNQNTHTPEDECKDIAAELGSKAASQAKPSI